MTYTVRVPEDYVCIVGRHVGEGQSVGPGEPLMDVMTPDGVVKTISSEGWGIVVHVEGNRVRKNNANDEEEGGDPCESGFMFTGGARGGVFMEGDLICHIIKRSDNNSIKGGKPHPSTSRAISNAKAVGALLPVFG